MENEMNVFEKIHYVQQHALPSGAASDGDLTAIMGRLRPHLGAVKLVVVFSEDMEECSGAAFVRSTATAINVEAPYDRTACTAYEPQRALSDGECPDATCAARKKAVEGLFALGDAASPKFGAAARTASAGQKTAGVEAGKTAAPRDAAAKKIKAERAASDADLGRALSMQVKMPTGTGSGLMALGDLTAKQLDIADQRFGWIEDIHNAIEIVKEFRGF